MGDSDLKALAEVIGSGALVHCWILIANRNASIRNIVPLVNVLRSVAA